MTSVAIVAGITMSYTALSAVAVAVAQGKSNEAENLMDTCFVDCDLLVKTLTDLDCHVEKISENQVNVATDCGVLKYIRSDESQAFRMQIDEISDPSGLLENIRSFEQDYGRNVQAYIYDHIVNNLTDDMSIADESVLEDNSLLLTINIE